MPEQLTRRETLRRGLAATSLLALVPEWATPALAQGETDVPFTDIPKTFNPNNPNAPVFPITSAEGLNHVVQVVAGVKETEARDLLQSFFRARRSGPQP